MTSPTTPSSSSTTPPTDLANLLSPIVPDSLSHNTRTLSKIHPPLSFLLGLCAGILSLHSLYGFGFYIAGTISVSVLIRVLLVGSSGGAGTGAGAGAGVGAYFPSSRRGDNNNNNNNNSKVRRDGGWRDVFWLFGGVMEGLSGFVLGWAGGGGVLR